MKIYGKYTEIYGNIRYFAKIQNIREIYGNIRKYTEPMSPPRCHRHGARWSVIYEGIRCHWISCTKAGGKRESLLPHASPLHSNGPIPLLQVKHVPDHHPIRGPCPIPHSTCTREPLGTADDLAEACVRAAAEDGALADVRAVAGDGAGGRAFLPGRILRGLWWRSQRKYRP